MTAVEVQVVDVVRVPSRSGWGNPRFEFVTADGLHYATKVDSAVAHGAENYRPHRHWGQESLPVTLHLERGHVVHVEGPDALQACLAKP